MKIVCAKYGRLSKEDKSSKLVSALDGNGPWLKGENLLFLGEIENMPGHGVYSRRTGEVLYGYHTDNFIDSDIDGHLYLDDYLELKKDPIDNKEYFCLSLKKLEQLLDVNFISKDLLKTFDDYQAWNECESFDEENE